MAAVVMCYQVPKGARPPWACIILPRDLQGAPGAHRLALHPGLSSPLPYLASLRQARYLRQLLLTKAL